MKFLYRILTNYGTKLEIEAESAEEACRLVGIAMNDCRKWYPSPIKRVLEPEEITKRAERFAKLQELAKARRKLRRSK